MSIIKGNNTFYVVNNFGIVLKMFKSLADAKAYLFNNKD